MTGMDDCATYMMIAAILGILIYQCMQKNGSFKKARMSNGLPQSAWLGATPQKQRLTGPISDNKDQGMLMMNPSQLANYMNAIYPPKTTTFKPGTDGITQCAVSSVNNCPSDLYYKCNQKSWSKEAIGEALALSSVGSYYLPSGVEEENLHKVVALAHDPTQAACANAAGLTPYSRTNPNLGGSGI